MNIQHPRFIGSLAQVIFKRETGREWEDADHNQHYKYKVITAEILAETLQIHSIDQEEAIKQRKKKRKERSTKRAIAHKAKKEEIKSYGDESNYKTKKSKKEKAEKPLTPAEMARQAYLAENNAY